jgi:GT2 family glycosyltransferase
MTITQESDNLMTQLSSEAENPVHPSVDVVLLSWNRAQLTLETVTNLLEQQRIQVEIWVVDQGSKEEDLKLLRETSQAHANVNLVELGHNVGVPAGRNIGTRLGHSPYVVSIDNDAVFESATALRTVVDQFERSPEVGVMGFRINNFYTKKDDDLSWVYPKNLYDQRDRSFIATRFCGCGHAMRRSVFEQVQGYDDDLFFYWEEVDLSYRVINLGYQLIYYPEIVILHKVSPEVRIRWQDQRFYFLVRNAIYMDFKYNRSWLKAWITALGYFLKGCYNGLITQTLRGIRDALPMCRNVSSSLSMPSLTVTPAARLYLWQHELVYRGSLWTRLRKEVFVKLPGQS